MNSVQVQCETKTKWNWCGCVSDRSEAAIWVPACKYIYLSNAVWYALHIIIHRSMWMKTMQFCQYTICFAQCAEGTLFASLAPCVSKFMHVDFI